MELEKIQG